MSCVDRFMQINCFKQYQEELNSYELFKNNIEIKDLNEIEGWMFRRERLIFMWVEMLKASPKV